MELTTTIVRDCFGPFFIFVRINYRICLVKKVDQLTLTRLFDLLSGNRVKAPRKLKNKFYDLRSELVDNSCSLLEVFSKVDELAHEYDDDIQWIIKAKLDEFLRHTK